MRYPSISRLAAFALALPLAAVAQEAQPEATAEAPAPAPDPATVGEHSSYGLGYRAGGEFAQQYGSFGITAADLQGESFMKGFLDAFRGDEPEVTEQQIQTAMQAFGDLVQTREEEIAAANLAKGESFFAENKARENVKTLESGLQYEVLEKGDGETYTAPKEGEPTQQFMVNYRGTLIDGTEFDASPKDQPVPMTLQVIDGVKEALTQMPVGAKWRLFIPSDLAYGEQRRSPEIGPNSALIFELELLDIKDAPAPRQGGMPFPMPGQ